MQHGNPQHQEPARFDHTHVSLTRSVDSGIASDDMRHLSYSCGDQRHLPTPRFVLVPWDGVYHNYRGIWAMDLISR